MATGNESKVDTKLFLTTAETIGSVAKDMDTCFQDFRKIMQSMRSYWQGDVSDDIKNVAESVQKSSVDILSALGGYRSALNEMAGFYDKTEKTVQESGKTLKFDKALR